MKRLKKIEALFHCVVMESELKSCTMYSYGLTPKDIKDFKDLKYIKSIKKGTFKFIAFKELINYIKTISNQDSDMKELFINYCENNEEVQFLIKINKILSLLNDKEYLQIYQLCKEILKNCPKHRDFISLIIYLLNNLVNTTGAVNISIQSLSDSNDSSKIQIIDLILNKKYTTALNYIAKNEAFTNQETQILSSLLEAIISKTNDSKSLIELTTTKQYSKIVEYLETKSNSTKLEEYILLLSKKYLEIKETGIIPPKEQMKDITINEAILTNNFEEALDLATKINNSEDNILLPILEDITNLIKSLSSKDNSTCIEQDELLKKSLTWLDNYLKDINQTQYKEITIELIKISVLGQDKTFSKVKNFLTKLENPSFNLEIGTFIQEFYYYLSKNDIEVARCYLNIINRINSMNSQVFVIDGLQKIFDITVKKVQFLESYQSISTKEETPKVSDNFLFKKLFSLLENLITPIPTSEEYLSDKYRELLNTKGLLILDAFSEERTRELEQLISEYEDLSSFRIITENGTQIVLRYSKLEKFIVIKDMLQSGFTAYQAKDYNLCIACFEKLVRLFNVPNTAVIARLASAYTYVGRFKEAEIYLTIATALTQMSKFSNDSSLSKNSQEEKKTFL